MYLRNFPRFFVSFLVTLRNEGLESSNLQESSPLGLSFYVNERSI